MSLTVTLSDAASLGYCRRGCRAFAERHGLNWNELVFHGLPAERLAKIDDSMAHDLIEQARRRQEMEDGR